MVATGSAEARRGNTCGGGCNANGENFAFAAMRGKTYGSCNTSAGSHAAAALRGKTCGSCLFEVAIQVREIMQLL